MANQLKGTLFYLYTNVRFTLIIFWIIISTILALSLITSYFMSEGTISFQLSFSVYVFCTIIGTWTVKNAIPYSIKLGSTRKNLYVSLGIYVLGFALFNSIIANTINKFFEVVFEVKRVGGLVVIASNSSTESFIFFHVAQFLGSNSWFTYVLVDAIICFFLLTSAFIIGLVFFRYGLLGGFVFLGIVLFTFIIVIAIGWLFDMIYHFLLVVFNVFLLLLFCAQWYNVIL